MKIALRLPLLWFSGVLAIVVCVSVGQLFDSLSHPVLRDMDVFWTRLAVVPVFEAATLSTLGSLMLPVAYYGANVLDKLQRNGAVPDDGWGENPVFAVFLLTSFVAIPAVAIFGIDAARLHEAYPMTRSQALWPAFSLWFVHGALNALHVWVLRAA